VQEDNVGGGKVLKALSEISYRLHRLFDSATFAEPERDLNRMSDGELCAEISDLCAEGWRPRALLADGDLRL